MNYVVYMIPLLLLYDLFFFTERLPYFIYMPVLVNYKHDKTPIKNINKLTIYITVYFNYE